MIEAVKRLRTDKERALKILSPKLHHYLYDRLVAASWYPEEDLLALVQANLKMLGVPLESGCDRLGILTAQEHYKSWYGKRVKTMDSRSVPLRLSSLWPALHDTGKNEFTIESPTSGRLIVRDFEHPSRELCLIIQSYTREFIHLSGFGKVTAKETACVLKGDVYCSWLFTWTKEI